MQNERTKHVQRKKPSYIAWTDELIKAEEKHIMRKKCFGQGEVLEWSENEDTEVYT